jgi:glucosamine-phosphate N-acetyltransferase
LIGILEVYAQLSVTGDISKQKFEGELTGVRWSFSAAGGTNIVQQLERFDFFKSTKTYFTTVIEDSRSGLVVACATLLVEYKFLHECGKVRNSDSFFIAYFNITFPC